MTPPNAMTSSKFKKTGGPTGGGPTRPRSRPGNFSARYAQHQGGRIYDGTPTTRLKEAAVPNLSEPSKYAMWCLIAALGIMGIAVALISMLWQSG